MLRKNLQEQSENWREEGTVKEVKDGRNSVRKTPDFLNDCDQPPSPSVWISQRVSKPKL